MRFAEQGCPGNHAQALSAMGTILASPAMLRAERGTMTKTTDSSEIKEAIADLIKNATKKTKAGVHDEAAELLEQALELEPENLRALDLLGFVQWSLGDLKASEETNRKSLKIRPLGAYARKGLGICLADQGKVDEGISEIHHAMALKPLWSDPIHDLVVVLFRAERYAEALPMIERALEVDEKLEAKLAPMRAECKKRLAEKSE